MSGMNIVWKPRRELKPEMSPVFIVTAGDDTFQIASFDETVQKWKMHFGMISVVLMDDMPLFFIPCREALPPPPSFTPILGETT